MTNTRIVYEYRDAAECCEQEILIVAGTLTLEQIVDTLDAGKFFIPNQVGLGDLQLRLDPETLSRSDRVWHRMVSMEPTEESPTVAVTAAQLHARFRDVIWDEEAALVQLRQYISDDVLGCSPEPSGKIIYLKRRRGQVPWDCHAWPVRLVGQDPGAWYGYSIHRDPDATPRPYSMLIWAQVPPPQATVIVLNFAGALSQEIWSELFAGWEHFSILPDLHHLLIDSEFRYANEHGVHERIALFLGQIARAHHWQERNWARYADAVLALYPEEGPLRTFLQRSLEKVLGRTPTDARADLARRRSSHS